MNSKSLDRLKDYQEYGISFNIAGEYSYVNVSLPQEWDVRVIYEYKSKGNSVNVQTYRGEDGVYTFYTNLANDITYLFTALDECIKINTEYNKRVILFNELVEKLAIFVQDKSIDEVSRIEFIVPKEKRKYSKKSKVSEETEMVEEVEPKKEEVND